MESLLLTRNELIRSLKNGENVIGCRFNAGLFIVDDGRYTYVIGDYILILDFDCTILEVAKVD